MSGYTMKQLLEWSREDQLIDGYSIRSDGRVEIRRGGKTTTYDARDAETMLRALIRRINQDTPRA